MAIRIVGNQADHGGRGVLNTVKFPFPSTKLAEKRAAPESQHPLSGNTVVDFSF